MIQKVFKYIQNDSRVIALSLLAGICAVVIYAGVVGVYEARIQNGIARNVIRLHVLANSDSADDQALKLAVRDGVLDAFEGELVSRADKRDMAAFLNEHLKDIEMAAADVIAQNGYGYGVSAAYAKSLFPRVSYGDATFPGGEYDALRIIIGEGKGKNWWCVMFPPLCYVDIASKRLPDESKEELMNALPPDCFDYVLPDAASNNAKVTYKFKIVEVFNDLFGKGE